MIKDIFVHTIKQSPDRSIELFLLFITAHKDKIEIGLNISQNLNANGETITKKIFSEHLLKKDIIKLI